MKEEEKDPSEVTDGWDESTLLMEGDIFTLPGFVNPTSGEPQQFKAVMDF